MVTTQTADNVLKTYYLDAVADQLNKNINPLLAKIKQTSSDVWGREVKKAVNVGVNGGISAGTETGDLPRANGNRYVQFVSTLKNLYGTIEISDKAIRASQNDEGAFVNLLNDEMQSLVKSAECNFGRMLFGDGSGALATLVDCQDDVYTFDNVDYLAEGMIVDVHSEVGALTQGAMIVSVDRNTRQVKFDNPITLRGNIIALYVQGSKDLEISGLGAIFSNSDTLYGVSRSQNKWLNPGIYGSVGEITEMKIQKAIDDAELRTGSKINFIVTSAGVRRALVEELSKYRHMDAMELEGGFRALSFNGIPVVVDRFCPKGKMYLLDTNDFALHQLCDWQWLEGEDGKVLKQIAGKPVYTATLVKYAELMCYRPAGQAMLSGITEK